MRGLVEALINYGIFFFVIIVLAIIISLVRKSSVLSSLFKFLGKVLLISLHIFMLGVFTAAVSLLVGIIIFIHPYLFGTPQFFANGEGVHLLTSQDFALLEFSLTYGIMYIILYFIALRFLVKTRLTAFFIRIARTIRQIVPYRRSHKRLENKIIGTACQLMATSLLLILYPIALKLLFPHLEMTWAGNLTIFVCLFIYSTVPTPREANTQERKSAYRMRTMRNKF